MSYEAFPGPGPSHKEENVTGGSTEY